jgi:hypothetical protein
MFRSTVLSRSSLRVLTVAVASAAVATTATGWFASASTHTASTRTTPAATATVAKAYVGRFNVGTDKVLSKKKHAITETPKLAAGNYLVNAAVNLAMFSQNGTQCFLLSAKHNKSGLGQAEEAQTPTGTSGINADLNIIDSYTKIASGDRILVVCRDYAEGSRPTEVNSAEINAIPVHAIALHKTS